MLSASSVADDLAYVGLADLAKSIGNDASNLRIIGGHMITVLAVRWSLGAPAAAVTSVPACSIALQAFKARLCSHETGLDAALPNGWLAQSCSYGEPYQNIPADIPAAPDATTATERPRPDTLPQAPSASGSDQKADETRPSTGPARQHSRPSSSPGSSASPPQRPGPTLAGAIPPR